MATETASARPPRADARETHPRETRGPAAEPGARTTSGRLGVTRPPPPGTPARVQRARRSAGVRIIACNSTARRPCCPAGQVPRSARRPDTTTLVPVGAVRVIELIADNPGDWAFHCHMTHHVMNQMGHDVPQLIGAETQGPATSTHHRHRFLEAPLGRTR
ncbi:MAG: multicopper oxidase domain-containing protein [Myxococcales bacterium]|nr:multicopper oxidase domain-containing protein [Myxococcales bacterium]